MSRLPPSPERQQRYRRGRSGEIAAAIMLMAKGYRILAWRIRTPAGEIDLVARRGRRIAFVEVKRRATREAAEAAFSPRQRNRLDRAAGHWLARRPGYQDHDIGLDAVLVLPWRWPIHYPDALQRP